LSDILQLRVDDSVTRTLQIPGAVLDPSTQRVVDAAVASAREEAFADGVEAGVAMAADHIERAASAIVGALADVHTELIAQRDAATAASLDLARATASAVLDRTPPSEALELLDTIRDTVALLDADELSVRVNPDDQLVLGELPHIPGLTFVADPSVATGEATIDGRHGGADLTREALLDAALAALGEGAR
jgi:flagellar biosynthesis/type III secretory pathway protein FliH